MDTEMMMAFALTTPMTSKCITVAPSDNEISRLYRLLDDLMHESLVKAGPKDGPNGCVSSSKFSACLNCRISEGAIWSVGD